MGPVSEVLRAPFVAVAGGDRVERYRAGLIPCLLLLAALGAALAFDAGRRGRGWWFQILVAVGLVVNPITLAAVHLGHPEEIVAAALLSGSVLMARRRRVVGSGVAAGLAVATKAWALAGIPVVFFALAGTRARRTFAIAAIVAALPIGLIAAGAPARFRGNLHEFGRLGAAPGTVSVTNVWWPVADAVPFDAPLGFDAAGRLVTRPASGYQLSKPVARLAHGAVLLAGLLVALAWRRRPAGPDTVLLALALALLIRCVLDPGTVSYYHTPFLVALVAYEAGARRRLPWLSLIVVATFELLTRVFAPAQDRAIFNAAYLVWALGLVGVIATELWVWPASRRAPLGPDGRRAGS
ncbi:MAG: glycosyltransferase 87 family protein [Thermoleophilaceae bacterium]